MGAIDGGTLGLWQVIVPTGTTDKNIISNPSAELNTTGWTTLNSSLSRVAGGRFGAYMFRALVTATGGGASFEPNPIAGTPQYVGSMWIKADSALVKLRLRDTSGTPLDTIAHPGDGQWHRLEVTGTPGTGPVLQLLDDRSSAWTNIDFDGAQIELGSIATTYIDGDQEGCSWITGPHAGQSERDARDGNGGRIVSFDSLGFAVTDMQGIGTPAVNIARDTLALADAARYQRSSLGDRVITLTGKIFGTGTPASLHTVRAALLAALNPDIRSNRGPIVLRYAGASVPKRLKVYYESGLEWNTIEAADETMPLRFVSFDTWEAESDSSLVISAGTTNITTNRMIMRDRNGRWSCPDNGTVDTAVTSIPIRAAGRLHDGRLLVGGDFLNMGTVAAADFLAVWDGFQWAAFGGVTPSDRINDILVAQNGDVYIAGVFSDFNGIANADKFVKWTRATNTFSAMGTGAASQGVTLAEDLRTGYIWAVAQGTIDATGVSLAYWNGTAWASGTAGATDGSSSIASRLRVGPDGAMYLSGYDGVGPNPRVRRWNGSSWVTIGETEGPSISDIIAHGGYLYACGPFTQISSVTVNKFARWNGTTWAPVGQGLGSGAQQAYRFAKDRDGNIYAAGNGFTTMLDGTVTPDAIAVWNGSQWVPIEVQLPNTATVTNDTFRVVGVQDGSLIFGWHSTTGTFGTASETPNVLSITNSGSANAYPILRFTGTQLVRITNFTTKKTIYFNYFPLYQRGDMILDFRPGRLAVYGENGENFMQYVLPSSDIDAFALAPGVNEVAIFGPSATGKAYWRTRYLSAD